jgi:hypothetical protein
VRRLIFIPVRRGVKWRGCEGCFGEMLIGQIACRRRRCSCAYVCGSQHQFQLALQLQPSVKCQLNDVIVNVRISGSDVLVHVTDFDVGLIRNR